MSGETRGERAKRLGLLATEANKGNRGALERLIAELRDDVYRLALRMTGHLEDAEDATQEVLIKILTRLSTWRGDALVTTWSHRVTVNHLLDRPPSRIEASQISFEAFGEDLLAGLDHQADPDDPEQAALAEEVRLACTTAMLQCLDRDHRIAYVLGEIVELDGEHAAWICNVTHATYRKRLSRSRDRIRTFMGTHCGLVSDHAPCRCERRIPVAVATGRVDPTSLPLTRHPTSQVGEMRRMVRAVDDLREAASVMRRHPSYAAPERLAAAMKDLIEGSVLLRPGDTSRD